MKTELTAALLKKGQQKLLEELELSTSEMSRKINGESGWTLDQLAKAFSFVGARIVTNDQEVIDRDELAALRTLARKALEK